MGVVHQQVEQHRVIVELPYDLTQAPAEGSQGATEQLRITEHAQGQGRVATDPGHVMTKQLLNPLRSRQVLLRLRQWHAVHPLHQQAHQVVLVAHVIGHRQRGDPQLSRQGPDAESLGAQFLQQRQSGLQDQIEIQRRTGSRTTAALDTFTHQGGSPRRDSGC